MIEKYHLRNPETLHEDVVMGYSEILFSRKVMFLNKYLYYYNRKNINRVTLERKKQYLRDFPLIFIGIQKILLEKNLYEQQKEWLTRFYFGCFEGFYESYSDGADLSIEMHEAILHYRTLFPDPLITGSEDYISNKLMKFQVEMQRNSLSEIFSLFIETHPEVHSLIHKNWRNYLLFSMYQLLRFKSVNNFYKRIVINPRSETRRIYIVYLIRIYKWGMHYYSKGHSLKIVGF